VRCGSESKHHPPIEDKLLRWVSGSHSNTAQPRTPKYSSNAIGQHGAEWRRRRSRLATILLQGPALPEMNPFHGNRLLVVRLDIAQRTAPPPGGSSTAPKGTREGPASLFTADRREPFTQEPVGAPLTCAASSSPTLHQGLDERQQWRLVAERGQVSGLHDLSNL
jgi:hypothetical protein